MSEEETKKEEERVLCDSCEWFLLKKGKPKCKYVKEEIRLAIIKTGNCAEYQRAHRLQVG